MEKCRKRRTCNDSPPGIGSALCKQTTRKWWGSQSRPSRGHVTLSLYSSHPHVSSPNVSSKQNVESFVASDLNMAPFQLAYVSIHLTSSCFRPFQWFGRRSRFSQPRHVVTPTFATRCATPQSLCSVLHLIGPFSSPRSICGSRCVPVLSGVSPPPHCHETHSDFLR